MTDEQKQQDEKPAEEVEEQGRRWVREDEGNEESGSDEDEGGEVEEQARFSDATLKHSITPIDVPISQLS